jgi:hypothetical protein
MCMHFTELENGLREIDEILYGHTIGQYSKRIHFNYVHSVIPLVTEA